MKSKAEIQLTKTSIEKNIDDLWNCHKFDVAHITGHRAKEFLDAPS